MYPNPTTTMHQQYPPSVSSAPSKYHKSKSKLRDSSATISDIPTAFTERGLPNSSGSTTSPSVSRIPIGTQGTDLTPTVMEFTKQALIIPLTLQQSNLKSKPSMFPSNKPTQRSENTMTSTSSFSLTLLPFAPSSTPTLHPSDRTTGPFRSDPFSLLTQDSNLSNTTISPLSLKPTITSSKTLPPTLHPSEHTTESFRSDPFSLLSQDSNLSNTTVSPLSLKPTITSSKTPLQSHMPSKPLSMLSSDKPTKGSMNTTIPTLPISVTNEPVVPTLTPTLHPSDRTTGPFLSDPFSLLTQDSNLSNTTVSPLSLKPTITSSKTPLQSHMPSKPPSMLSSDKPTKGSMNTTIPTLPISVTNEPIVPTLTPTLHPSEHTWTSDPFSLSSPEHTSRKPASKITANSTSVPSRESLTSAPISSASSKPSTSPSKIPHQSHSPSEARNTHPFKPIKGYMNPSTATSLSFILTAKPSSSLTFTPSVKPTFHPTDYAIQSDPLSLQTLEQNSPGSTAKANSTLEPSKLDSLIMRPALLSSLAVVVISIFALFVVIALKLNEKFRKQNNRKLFTQEEDIVYFYDTPTSLTHDGGFSSNFYPQHQVTPSAGHLGMPENCPNFVFDIFDCRQAMVQPPFREESDAFNDNTAESFNVERTHENDCAGTVVSNLTSATFPTNRDIEIDDCPTKVDGFDSNSSILTFLNECSDKKLRDSATSNNQAYSGHLDQIIEESSSCAERSVLYSDQDDPPDNSMRKPIEKNQRNDDESLDSYTDLRSRIKNATATETSQVDEEHSEGEILIDLDSYSDFGVKHQNREVSKQVSMYENESDDSETSMGSYEASWEKKGDKRVNRIIDEIVEDSSCLESQAGTVDINFDDERGFGSHYC